MKKARNKKSTAKSERYVCSLDAYRTEVLFNMLYVEFDSKEAELEFAAAIGSLSGRNRRVWQLLLTFVLYSPRAPENPATMPELKAAFWDTDLGKAEAATFIKKLFPWARVARTIFHDRYFNFRLFADRSRKELPGIAAKVQALFPRGDKTPVERRAS